MDGLRGLDPEAAGRGRDRAHPAGAIRGRRRGAARRALPGQRERRLRHGARPDGGRRLARRLTSLGWALGVPSYGCAQFSKRRPATLRNSRSLFETRINLRPIACAAISVSNGPMGVPARSSFARTLAWDAASLVRTDSARIALTTTSPGLWGRRRLLAFELRLAPRIPARPRDP